jgi:hypothetical protein
MAVNHVVLAKIVSVAQAMLKPDIVASEYIEKQLEPKFHMTAAGKIRSNAGDLKVKKYFDTVLRAEMPSLFLEAGQADKGGNVKGKNNPWGPGAAWSVTRQGEIMKSLGAEKAAAIAKAAGSFIGATKPGATKRMTQAYEKGADGRPTRVA